MKKLAAILCLSAMATGAFAQGVVIFNNSPTTLVSAGANQQTATSISGPAGSYYFGLLTSASGAAGSFSFTGLYATNSGAAPGRFIGGTVSVPGWAAGTTMSYEIAGWDSSILGHNFNASWLTSNPQGFGLSSVASGVAGGTTAGGQSFPTLPLFGGTGLGSGFLVTTVPEPSSMALAGLGAAALLIFRRRK